MKPRNESPFALRSYDKTTNITREIVKQLMLENENLKAQEEKLMLENKNLKAREEKLMLENENLKAREEKFKNEVGPLEPQDSNVNQEIPSVEESSVEESSVEESSVEESSDFNDDPNDKDYDPNATPQKNSHVTALEYRKPNDKGIPESELNEEVIEGAVNSIRW